MGSDMTDQTVSDGTDEAASDEAAEERAVWAEFDEAERAAASDGRDDDADPDEDLGDEGGNASADDQPADGQRADSGKADTPNPWVNATDEQKAALAELEAKAARAETVEHENRSNRARMSALQRQINDFKAGSGQGAASSKDGAATAHPSDIRQSDAWKAFADEYPEIAKPLGDAFTAQGAELSTVRRELSSFSDERRQENLNAQEGFLATEHTDWKGAVASEEFGKWLVDQPAYVQQAAVRNAETIVDGQEAAHIVGMFKAIHTPAAATANDGDRQSDTTRPHTSRRKHQLDSAEAPRSRGAGPATGTADDGDEEAHWRQLEREGL